MSRPLFQQNDGKTDPATIAWLLSMANDIRVAGGLPALDELPKSVPTDPYHCVIANAFNFNCEVSPAGKGRGGITFQTASDALNYVKITGQDEEVVIDYLALDPDTKVDLTLQAALEQCEEWRGEIHLPLTPELNEVALMFDRGELFKDYIDVDQYEKYAGDGNMEIIPD